MDLFELLCKVLDQNLFTQVDWARNSYYFKDLKVRRRNILICLCVRVQKSETEKERERDPPFPPEVYLLLYIFFSPSSFFFTTEEREFPKTKRKVVLCVCSVPPHGVHIRKRVCRLISLSLSFCIPGESRSVSLHKSWAFHHRPPENASELFSSSFSAERP